MSQAMPMTSLRRAEVYYHANRQDQSLTDRQSRHMYRMEKREEFRALGLSHGATGAKIRRPKVYPSLPPEGGSIRTHEAVRCDPCGIHLRRTLHRFPKRT